MRYRIQAPHGMLVLVGLHSSKGSFAGNFQTFLKATRDSSDNGDWRVLETPLSALKRTWIPPRVFPKAVASSWSTWLVTLLKPN